MRADQKLAYAQTHLNELRGYRHWSRNHTWENAHQESYFYHLAGAVEALLHEVNSRYSLGLELKEVDWFPVNRALSREEKVSPAFEKLNGLRNDDTSWLSQLFEWRNQGTHRHKISKVIYASNTEVPDNEFRDPRTDRVQTVFPGLGCQEVIEKLFRLTADLIDECRKIDQLLSTT